MALSELFSEEKRRLHELELQLQEHERGSGSVQLSDIRISISEMSRRFDELEKLVNQETKSRRVEMKRRLQHLKTTYSNLVTSLDNYDKRRYSKDISLQRQELFRNTTVLNDPELAEIEIQENNSLQNSNRMLSEYLLTGQETLSELMSQKERFKNIQKKVFDIINLLGISGNILKNVEKRDYYDKWIVFIGMFVTLLVLGVVYFFLRG